MNIDVTALDAFLEEKHRSLRLPGLAAAIVQDGRIVHLRTVGNAAPGRAMTPQTPLVIGSLSKSFTALAVMQLVERGALALDDPIQCYLPWFAIADKEASAHITLRHLLTHTSGFSRYVGRDLLSRRKGSSLEAAARALRTVRLVHMPGSRYEYSNTNYMLLGLLIEVASGESYPDYIQRHIFGPLGMRHSHTSEASALADGLSCGYRWWFGLPVPFHAPYLQEALPAAFLASSAGDMARWLIAHLNGGEADGVSILSPGGIAALHRAQVPTGKETMAAMGWRVEQHSGETMVRHGGEVSNFRADMLLVPDHKLGVVILANCNNGLVAQLGLDQIALDVVRLLLGQQAPTRQLTFPRFYALLDVTLVALSLYQGWSLTRLLRFGSTDRRGRSVLGLATLCEMIFSVGALRAIPRLADSPWSLLKMYVPDISAWLAAWCCGSLVKALVVLARLVFLRWGGSSPRR